jgi:hypothetical protein
VQLPGATITSTTNSLTPSSGRSPLLRLPQEIRERIFTLCIPEAEAQYTSRNQGNPISTATFPTSLGDPSGFYFPIHTSSSIGLLGVSRQLRSETLPLAYSATSFQFGDIDDAIKGLLAIGTIGRAAVRRISLSWTSQADAGIPSADSPTNSPNGTKLPWLHTELCVRLLKECRRLEFLQIRLEEAALKGTGLATFCADGGVRALTTVRVREVQVLPEKNVRAKWLKGNMRVSA